MINAETIIDNHIKTPLKNMTDVFYVNGWVKIYLDELQRNNKAAAPQNVLRPKFPIVAVHVIEDTFTTWNLEQFTVQRQIVISGAIDVKSRTDIDSRLQTLYRDTIKAMVESLDPVKDKNKITLNNSKFTIPDDSTDYAMFELMITTTTHEDTTKWLT